MALNNFTEAQFTTSGGAVDAEQLRREFKTIAPVGVGFPSTGAEIVSIQVFEPGANPRATLETDIALDATDISTALVDVIASHDALGHTEGFQNGNLESFGDRGVLQNLFLDSENFDEAGAWTDPLNETTTVTDNVIGPDGQLNADTVTWDDGIGLGKRQSAIGCVSGNPYTFYGWIRFAAGVNATLNFDLKDGLSVQITATAEWQRFRVEMTAGVGSDFFDITHFGGTAGDAFEFSKFQLVDGHDNHEHPYVFTSSTVRHTAVGVVGSSAPFATAVGRTLYVDQNQAVSRQTGAPDAPFANINAGIAAAIALSPSLSNPVSVVVASGNYVENITLVTGMTVRSMDGAGLTRITAPGATDTIVTGAANSTLIGFALFGANGSGGIAYTVAGNATVKDCRVQDCETGYECTAGVLFVEASVALRISGQVLTTGYRATGGGQVHAWISRAIGLTAQIATGFLSTGASSQIHVHAGACVNNAVGLQATDSGLVQTHAIRFANCDVCRLVGPATLGDMRTVGSVGLANTLDLQVTGTAATVEMIGDQATADKVLFLDDTAMSGFTSEPQTDEADAGVRTYASTSIGDPDKVVLLAAGQGVATAKELQVFQFDDSAVSGSKLTDISTVARSRTGSTFTFPGSTTAADALLFGAHHRPGGVIMVVDTAMSADGVLAWEYWNGAAWVEMPPGGTRGSGIMVHGPIVMGAVSRANIAWEQVEAQHIHFNSEIISSWPQDIGTLDQVPVTTKPTYWIRVRMATLPTTTPVFEQGKALYSTTTVGSTGIISHGGARVRTRIPIFSNLFQSGFGNVPGAQDLSYSANVDIGLTTNAFSNNGLDQAGLIISIPNVFDTSSPIEIELEWHPSTTDTGDVNWELFYVLANTDSIVSASAGAGTLTEFTDVALQTASGVVGQGQVATFNIRLPNANPENSDSIALIFRRDATGAGPPDTFLGDAVVRRISMNGLVWRSGRA